MNTKTLLVVGALLIVTNGFTAYNSSRISRNYDQKMTVRGIVIMNNSCLKDIRRLIESKQYDMAISRIDDEIKTGDTKLSELQ
jgi:hypothetical protein